MLDQEVVIHCRCLVVLNSRDLLRATFRLLIQDVFSTPTLILFVAVRSFAETPECRLRAVKICSTNRAGYAQFKLCGRRC